jgi:hypothetical protein
MDKLLTKLEVKSVNGTYYLYQFLDSNPLPRIELYLVSNDKETKISNVYGELRKLNEEFSLRIQYEPSHRTKLNTREFAKAFIDRYKF